MRCCDEVPHGQITLFWRASKATIPRPVIDWTSASMAGGYAGSLVAVPVGQVLSHRDSASGTRTRFARQCWMPAMTASLGTLAVETFDIPAKTPLRVAALPVASTIVFPLVWMGATSARCAPVVA